MEEDMKALIKVTAWITTSMTYARFASSAIQPGKFRLLALFPVIILLPFLPWYFSSINLRGISAFSLPCLGLFKLLLLSFGLGPLSPSLPLLPFLFTSSLPVKLCPSKSFSPYSLPPLLPTTIKVLLLSFLISLYRYKDQIHPYLLLAIYCLHIYLALDLVLASAVFLVGSTLGLDIEPQFNAPFKSASLQDFWGRRWNLMVTSILRPSVYYPVRARWGTTAGIMATFLVSGLMHEFMFYYLTLAGPTGEVSCFFVLHGLCTLAEVRAKRGGWWRPHPAVAAPLVVGFVAVTGIWLFFPPLLRSGADAKALEECAAVMGFLEDGRRDLVGRLGSMWNATRPAVW